MAALSGSVAASPIGGNITPSLTPAMHGFAVDYWPPHAARISDAPEGPLTTAWPVAANGRAIAGSIAHGYLQDYYYRVHVTPTHIDLGNLVSAQQRKVRVWNAWPDQSLTLTDVQALNATGITADGEGALPLAFNPLQERAWQVAVSTNGSPVIDAQLQWLFAGLAPVSVAITGNRLIAWMIAPDWANDLTETLTWLNDVQVAADGTQVRQPYRAAPDREWEFGVIVAGDERQILEAALYDWSARVWALPVWTDASWLASALSAGSASIALDTTDHDYTLGGLVILWQSAARFELGEVVDIAANALTLKQGTTQAWSKGTRVLPCRTATLTDFPALARQNDQQMQAQVRFAAAEDCEWPSIAPATTYLGMPVLEARSNEPQDLAAAYGRHIVRISNDLGTPVIDDFSGLAWPTQSYYWLVRGRAERAALRSLLYWLGGRGNALWLPSGNSDVTLTATVGASATALTVAWAGITRHLHGQPGRRHIRIELLGGAVYYRRVTAMIELDADHEQLAIDSPLGVQVEPAQVRQVSWMMLATLNSDRVEIGHVHESAGTATAAVTFAGVPMEEP